jgi:hypothetical protein
MLQAWTFGLPTAEPKRAVESVRIPEFRRLVLST